MTGTAWDLGGPGIQQSDFGEPLGHEHETEWLSRVAVSSQAEA